MFFREKTGCWRKNLLEKKLLEWKTKRTNPESNVIIPLCLVFLIGCSVLPFTHVVRTRNASHLKTFKQKTHWWPDKAIEGPVTAQHTVKWPYLRLKDELWAVILSVCSSNMVYLPANFQPTSHRIAKVMANARYRRLYGPFLTGSSKGLYKGPKNWKIEK